MSWTCVCNVIVTFSTMIKENVDGNCLPCTYISLLEKMEVWESIASVEITTNTLEKTIFIYLHHWCLTCTALKAKVWEGEAELRSGSNLKVTMPGKERREEVHLTRSAPKHNREVKTTLYCRQRNGKTIIDPTRGNWIRQFALWHTAERVHTIK